MKRTTMWAIMRAHGWDSLTVNGFPVATPDEGPHKFIPVFNTKREAIAWQNGSRKNVAKLEAI